MPQQKSFNLVTLTDKHMTREGIYLPREAHWYPSEASVAWEDSHGIARVSGNCMRKSFLRYTGLLKAEGVDAYTQWIFALGKAVENILVEQWKQMGIWHSNNVKFYNAEYNISGEIDCILREPETGRLFAVECCTPDSLILDADYQLYPFEHFQSSDVIDQHGNSNQVANIQIKDVSNIPIYSLHGKFDGLLGGFTEEHPIIVAKVRVSRYLSNKKKRTYHFESTSIKPASQVTRGDYVCIPKARFGEILCETYQDFVSQKMWPYLVENDLVFPARKIPSNYKPIPNKIRNLSDFYWLLGLYLAEGSCSKHAVYFSLHQKETKIIARIQQIVQSLWGLDIGIRHLKDSRTKQPSNGINIEICSIALRTLFKSIIPGNTLKRTKRIYYHKLVSDPQLLDQLLRGAWLGDGCYASKRQYRLTTAVPTLAYFYFQVAARLGFSPRVKKYNQQSYFNSDHIYAVEWGTGGNKHNIEPLIDAGTFWCYKVKKITSRLYSGKVYNLECLPDHTYTVGTIATHNCKSFYGYYATKEIMGNRQGPGRPKTSQLLQTLIYLYECKHLFPFGKMIYYARDSGERKEFTIELQHEALPEGKVISRPVIDGLVDYRFNVEDIYSRYRQLSEYVMNSIMPQNDYEISWSAEKIEQRKELGEVSKSAYDDWKKGKGKVGDWQCRYCPYQDFCWDKHGQPKDITKAIGTATQHS